MPTARSRAPLSLARLKSALDTVPVGIVVTDARRRDNPAVYVNDCFLHITGYAPDEIIGRNLRMLQGPETSPEGVSEMRRAVAEGRPCSVEVINYRKSGEPFWMKVEIAPMRDEAGRITNFVGVLSDTTPLRQEAERLRAAMEEIERASRGRMRFFASASHDLRQPMQALALFVSALEGQVEKPSMRNAVSAIKASLKAMEDMFDAILDMSRIDAGVIKAEPLDFLVGDVLEAMETEFASQARSKGLDFRLVPSSAAVRSDPTLLARILRNLLSNALRYTDSGAILLGCRRRGDHLRIEVWDTGRGIPESQRLTVFDEFFRGTSRGGAAGGGTGLGLAIVQRLARLLQHRLEVRSTEGKGSVFAIEVPVVESREEVEDCSENESAQDLAGAVVAVVDDDRDILDALRMLLREWGCRPVAAAAADEVLAELSRLQLDPDIVLVDLKLRSQGDGLEAITLLRRRLGDPTIPAFVFTGATDDREIARIAARGVPLLRKPINPQRLRTVLAEAYRLRRCPPPN